MYATNGKQHIKTKQNFIMASVYQKELFCEVCKLQFDKKSVYDIHLSFVHGQKKPNIKSENDIKQENYDCSTNAFNLDENPLHTEDNLINHQSSEGQIISVVFGEESTHFNSCICPQNVELVHSGALEVSPSHVVLVTIIKGEDALVGMVKVFALI